MTTVAVLIPTTGRALQMEERVGKLLRQWPPANVNMAVVLSIPGNDRETYAAAERLQAGIMHRQADLYGVIRRDDTTAVEGWLMAYEYAHHHGADWFVLGADDIEWHASWLRSALQIAQQTGRAVIGLNDCHTDLSDYAPHYMMRRDYAERFGFIPAEYRSWWFDRDVCQAARLRGEYAPAFNAYAEHMHPDWRKAAVDDTYRAGMVHRDADKALYERRKERGFYVG